MTSFSSVFQWFKLHHRWPYYPAGRCQAETVLITKHGIIPAMVQMGFFKQLDISFPTNKQTADSRKLRGGYYTPLDLAHYLVKWGMPIFYDDRLEIDPSKVEDLLRRKQPYEALDYVDNIVLKNHLGFDDFMIGKIRNAWEQLRDRRVDRK